MLNRFVAVQDAFEQTHCLLVHPEFQQSETSGGTFDGQVVLDNQFRLDFRLSLEVGVCLLKQFLLVLLVGCLGKQVGRFPHGERNGG